MALHESWCEHLSADREVEPVAPLIIVKADFFSKGVRFALGVSYLPVIFIKL